MPGAGAPGRRPQASAPAGAAPGRAAHRCSRSFQPMCGTGRPAAASKAVTRPGTRPRPSTPPFSSLPSNSSCRPRQMPRKGRPACAHSALSACPRRPLWGLRDAAARRRGAPAPRRGRSLTCVALQAVWTVRSHALSLLYCTNAPHRAPHVPAGPQACPSLPQPGELAAWSAQSRACLGSPGGPGQGESERTPRERPVSACHECRRSRRAGPRNGARGLQGPTAGGRARAAPGCTPSAGRCSRAARARPWPAHRRPRPGTLSCRPRGCPRASPPGASARARRAVCVRPPHQAPSAAAPKLCLGLLA